MDTGIFKICEDCGGTGKVMPQIFIDAAHDIISGKIAINPALIDGVYVPNPPLFWVRLSHHIILVSMMERNGHEQKEVNNATNSG